MTQQQQQDNFMEYLKNLLVSALNLKIIDKNSLSIYIPLIKQQIQKCQSLDILNNNKSNSNNNKFKNSSEQVI